MVGDLIGVAILAALVAMAVAGMVLDERRQRRREPRRRIVVTMDVPPGDDWFGQLGRIEWGFPPARKPLETPSTEWVSPSRSAGIR